VNTPGKHQQKVILQKYLRNKYDRCFAVDCGATKQNLSHLFVVGAGTAKRSTATVVFTLFPDRVLGDADVEVEFDTTEISLNRCS